MKMASTTSPKPIPRERMAPRAISFILSGSTGWVLSRGFSRTLICIPISERLASRFMVCWVISPSMVWTRPRAPSTSYCSSAIRADWPGLLAAKRRNSRILFSIRSITRFFPERNKEK